MDILNDQGRAVNALFVGGCVRNALLGLQVTDIDVASVLEPDAVTLRLSQKGMKVIPTGIAHGTVTAVVDGQAYQITTLRRDVSTDGRRAVVAFTKDWRQDAARRDFTINTILADCEGHIFDPTEQGLSDLEARRVLFVGDPALRIAEDYLRILRFFRFHLYYGLGEPDAAAIQACADAAERISDLSGERVTQEILKIMAHPKPAPVLKLMHDVRVLEYMFENNIDYGFLGNLCALQSSVQEEAQWSIAARLKIIEIKPGKIIFSKSLKSKVKQISEIISAFDLQTDQGIKTAIYKHGRAAVKSAVLIRQAHQNSSVKDIIQVIDLIDHWQIPVFPVTGHDLIKEGYKPGPALGKKLREMEREWMEKF